VTPGQALGQLGQLSHIYYRARTGRYRGASALAALICARMASDLRKRLGQVERGGPGSPADSGPQGGRWRSRAATPLTLRVDSA